MLPLLLKKAYRSLKINIADSLTSPSNIYCGRCQVYTQRKKPVSDFSKIEQLIITGEISKHIKYITVHH